MVRCCRLQTDAQRKASELGIALVVPDTSPPRLGIAGEEEWALGVGAGFYVDAETGAVSLSAAAGTCYVPAGTSPMPLRQQRLLWKGAHPQRHFGTNKECTCTLLCQCTRVVQ